MTRARVLGALLFALLAWCGVSPSVQAPMPTSVQAAAGAYLDAGDNASAAVINDVFERASNYAYDQTTSSGVVDLRPRGAWERSHYVVSHGVYDYDDSDQLVLHSHRHQTADSQFGELAARPAVAPPSSVATNTEATVVNAVGRAYPRVLDPRTGQAIPAPPSGLSKVPVGDRVPWGGQQRGAYIKEWYDRGYSTPEGGWSKYDIHHITPREYGGTNDFENLVPVDRTVHQQEFNPWWMNYGG